MTTIDLTKKLADTYEDHVKQLYNPIEAGDLANEMGKTYMKQLYKSIDNNRESGLAKIWIVVLTKKDPAEPRKIKLTIGILEKPLRYMRENADLWSYDYKKEKLELRWSLPHRTDMKNFLVTPEKYTKEIIHWIKTYIKQEGIDLTDNTSQVVPS